MKRSTNTNELIKRQGGELRGTNEGYVTKNTQPSYLPPDQGSENETLVTGDFSGISGSKFDVAVAFFEKKGVPRTLARTYGAALLDTSKSTGKDITQLVKVTSNNKIQFVDDTLTHINLLRSKTSQIGYKEPTTEPVNEFISRSIVI